MKTIELTQGYVALVDDEDYGLCVSMGPWHAKIKRKTALSRDIVYAAHTFPNGKTSTLYLHRFILGVTDPLVEVDHKDHNGLNCQRENIRQASSIQNQRNQQKRNVSSSKFKGVSSHRKTGWKARIYIDNEPIYLGLFLTPEEAALAYDAAARELFGEFAHTNF